MDQGCVFWYDYWSKCKINGDIRMLKLDCQCDINLLRCFRIPYMSYICQDFLNLFGMCLILKVNVFKYV